MSLRALPLLVIPLVLYNIVVVFAGGGPATGPSGRSPVQAADAQRGDLDVHAGAI